MRNINFAAVYHMPWLEYRHALPDGRVCLRLQTGRGEFSRVLVKITSNYAYPEFFQNAAVYELTVAYRDEWHDWYEIVFEPADRRIRYLFVLESDEQVFKLDASGLHHGADYFEDASESFAFAFAYPASALPDWARGCVGYEIFPDRFRRAGGGEEGLEPWESDRVQNEFRFGGNLRGIIEAVPYLKELGVTLVYTMPLFLSDTSHRYNTFDYFKIDPLLGTEDDVRELADALHQNGMRLMMDGVFNHSGVEFAPFQDAVQKGDSSPYRDWFFFDDTEECGYQTFGHWPYMPKLNLKNPDCAAYFLEVGRYWLRTCHIDGWRLDVSPEVWPDFWRQYHTMMKTENSDSLMVAECWDDSREWLTSGDMFDSTMHYVWSRGVWNRLCEHKTTLQQFDGVMNRALMLYPERVQQGLWNFLGTHDTPRVRTRAGGDLRMQQAAAFFQFTFPGSPILYYGDELGMEGGGDPYCRFPMRWKDAEGNQTHAHYRLLAQLRRDDPALRLGSFRTWRVCDNGVYAYLRQFEHQQTLCVLNTATEPVTSLLPLPEGMAEMSVVTDLYSSRTLPVQYGSVPIALNVGEGMILA